MDINYTFNEEDGTGQAVPKRAYDLNSLHYEMLDILRQYVPANYQGVIEKIVSELQERIIDRILDNGLVVNLKSEQFPIRLYKPPNGPGDFVGE